MQHRLQGLSSAARLHTTLKRYTPILTTGKRGEERWNSLGSRKIYMTLNVDWCSMSDVIGTFKHIWGPQNLMTTRLWAAERGRCTVPSRCRRRRPGWGLRGAPGPWRPSGPAGWRSHLWRRCCLRAWAAGTRGRWWSPALQGLGRTHTHTHSRDYSKQSSQSELYCQSDRATSNYTDDRNVCFPILKKPRAVCYTELCMEKVRRSDAARRAVWHSLPPFWPAENQLHGVHCQCLQLWITLHRHR